MITLKELESALKIIDKYNKMDFKDFIILIEEFRERPIADAIKKEWKFAGLNNVDFFMFFKD